MQDAASTSSGGGDNAASRNEKRDERASFVKSFVSLNGQTLENMEYKMVSLCFFDGAKLAPSNPGGVRLAEW